MRLTKKYKPLFELDMLKAYYKLDHIEQIRLQDNYVVPRFKDCSFLNYMKENNYFTNIDKNESLEDIIKRYETVDFSNREIKNKIDYEYDLLKIYHQYVEGTNHHPLEIAGDVGVIFLKNNPLELCPFLYEMLRNGYFHNGSNQNLSMQSIESLINIYENEKHAFIQDGDSIFDDDETYDKYYVFLKKYSDFKDIDHWKNVFSKLDNELIRVESIVQNDCHTACRVRYSICDTGMEGIDYYFASNLDTEYVIEKFYKNVNQELDNAIENKKYQLSCYEYIKRQIFINIKSN